jgi:hypothetical protein
MKRILYFVSMVVAFVGMMLIFSTKTMAATMPEGEFAGITIEKGNVNNVKYETGGVGLEERSAMQKSMKDYNLRLTFATMKGLYLASVPVQIKAADGKVLLSKESNGPWFWVNLPAGQYEVVASYDKKQEVRKVDLSKSPQRVEFTWKRAK